MGPDDTVADRVYAMLGLVEHRHRMVPKEELMDEVRGGIGVGSMVRDLLADSGLPTLGRGQGTGSVQLYEVGTGA